MPCIPRMSIQSPVVGCRYRSANSWMMRRGGPTTALPIPRDDQGAEGARRYPAAQSRAVATYPDAQPLYATRGGAGRTSVPRNGAAVSPATPPPAHRRGKSSDHHAGNQAALCGPARKIEEALIPALTVEKLEDGSYAVLVPSVPTPAAAQRRAASNKSPTTSTAVRHGVEGTLRHRSDARSEFRCRLAAGGKEIRTLGPPTLCFTRSFRPGARGRRSLPVARRCGSVCRRAGC